MRICRRMCLLLAACCWAAACRTMAADIVLAPRTPGQSQVFVVGQTMRFPVTVTNETETVRNVNVRIEFTDYFGKTAQVAAQDATMQPKSAAELTLTVKAEKTGSFSPVFKADGAADVKWTTVGVVPQPVEGPRPLSIFGISGEFDDREQAWELMRLMGIKWVRGDLAWPKFQEKSSDEWKPYYDFVFEFARAKHMGLLATVGYTHNFAAQEYDGGYERAGVRAPHTAPIKPECLRDWEKFCGRLARERSDIINYWEIWNEADLSFYYGTTGEYMAMHKAAWCAIKAANPEAIIMGGNSCVCPYFIRQVIPDGFMECSDAFSQHYPFSFDTPIGWDRTVFGYSKPNQEKTGFRKMSEMTEGGNLIYQGRGEPFGITSDYDKTRILVKEHMFNCRQQLGKFYQFTFRKWDSVGWGFLPQHLSYPYPHFVSHAVMAKTLEDHDYVGHLDVGPGFSAFVFQKNMQPVTVAWKGDYIIPAGEGVLTLDAGTKSATRTDLMGGTSKLDSNDGTFRLNLDQEPVYILGGDKRLMARALVARAKAMLPDIRGVAGTVAPPESAEFIERICAATEQRCALLNELKYAEFTGGFSSPLAGGDMETLLADGIKRGTPIPAYNVFHKLCELAEVEWLQAGIAQDGALKTPGIGQVKGRLASVKAQIEKANSPAVQSRVNDALLWIRFLIAYAERAVQMNNGKLNGFSSGQIAFANELLDQAVMLAKYEPKSVLNVFLTLDLPKSIHQGGRWERKVLVRADGDLLKTPAVATVCNRLGAPAKGALKMSLPDGWQAAPASIAYDVPPNEDRSYTFEITIPKDAPFIRHDGKVRLSGTLGADELFPATQPVEVWAPLAVTVRPAGTKMVEVRSSADVMDIAGAQVAIVGDSGRIGQSDVTVALDNWDKQPWSGEVRLVLPDGWISKPAEQKFGPIGHYQTTSVAFSVFYPSDVSMGPQYPVLARAHSGGKMIGLGVTGTGGKWRYREGSDPAWKNADYDDSTWELRNTEHVHKHGYVGDVWFRSRIFVPKDWGENDLLVNFGVPGMAMEGFFNGRKIGQIGEWPPLWAHSWGDYAEFRVDKSAVKPGSWNTIAARVFIAYSSGGITPGFVRPVK